MTAPADREEPERDEPEHLVGRASSGDREAMHALLERYLPGLQRWLRQRAGRWMAAKESSADLAQSVCREVLEHLATNRVAYRGEAQFRQWLYNTALFKIKNRRRYYHRQKRDVVREQLHGGDGDVAAEQLLRTLRTPSADAIVREDLARFEAAFAQLPEQCREILVMARLEGRSHREIAERLGITEGNSRVILSRVLARLARLMTEDDDEGARR